MSKPLYAEDMEMREFTATVKSVSDEKYVILDQTAFYPKSGGVDCDTGVLIRQSDGKEFPVVFVGKFKGNVSHEVAEAGLHEGDHVSGKINWDRRFELMRYHTAAHILSGVFFQVGDVKITGNNLTLGKGRIDFNLEDFDRNLIEKLVEKANKRVQEDLPVTVSHITRQELEQSDDLMKLAMSLPKSIQNVRIVDIGFDRQPDGGCHVSHLAEVGRIEVTKIQNKGKNNRRLYFQLHEQ